MSLRRAPRLLGVALLATAFVAACDDNDDDDDMMGPDGPGTITDIVAGSDDFETLNAALEAAGLSELLDGSGPLTVFAPTDDAFDALPPGTVDDLLLPENVDLLTDILGYHGTAENLSAEDVIARDQLQMLNGARADITVDGSTVRINDAVITTTDVEASNGTIHVIDAVLTPPPTIFDIAAGSEDFQTLTAAIEAAELEEVLDDPNAALTVFAPTDDAFAALPPGTVDDLLLPENQAALVDLLTYHSAPGRLSAEEVVGLSTLTMSNGGTTVISVSGETVTIDGAVITMTDIQARNGVIHVIDAVLSPLPSIYEIAAGSADFETLTAAVDAAELDGTLSDPTADLTVFAPTDDAFAALPPGTVEDLLLPENQATLVDILTYHVTAGSLFAEDVVAVSSLPMLNGGTTSITVMGETVMIDEATITVTDIQAQNGVVHVIDAVITP